MPDVTTPTQGSTGEKPPGETNREGLLWSDLNGNSNRDSWVGRDPETGLFAVVSFREKSVEDDLLMYRVEIFDRAGDFLSRDPGLPRPKLPHFSNERAKEWAEWEIQRLREKIQENGTPHIL